MTSNILLVMKIKNIRRELQRVDAKNTNLLNKQKDIVKEKKEAVKMYADLAKKHENLVQKLRDKVECPVCLDVPKKAPIPVCPNGHVVCSKCLREECPECLVKMGQGTSTLAVTVIEHIDHECENDGCQLKFQLEELAEHGKCCDYRPVKCLGLTCNTKVSLASLATHMLSCGNAIGNNTELNYMFPRQFKYTIRSGRLEKDLVWGLYCARFDQKMFVVKVAKYKGRWFFMVQMAGSKEDAAKYGVTIIVHKPGEQPEGKYSQRYYGDVCPIDVTNWEAAEERGLCLTLANGAMKRFLVQNSYCEDMLFSVYVDLYEQPM